MRSASASFAARRYAPPTGPVVAHLGRDQTSSRRAARFTLPEQGFRSPPTGRAPGRIDVGGSPLCAAAMQRRGRRMPRRPDVQRHLPPRTRRACSSRCPVAEREHPPLSLIRFPRMPGPPAEVPVWPSCARRRRTSDRRSRSSRRCSPRAGPDRRLGHHERTALSASRPAAAGAAVSSASSPAARDPDVNRPTPLRGRAGRLTCFPASRPPGRRPGLQSPVRRSIATPCAPADGTLRVTLVMMICRSQTGPAAKPDAESRRKPRFHAFLSILHTASCRSATLSASDGGR